MKKARSSDSSTSNGSGEAHEIPVSGLRHAKSLPDLHHSTLLGADAPADGRAISGLHGYMERVAELQRADRMFEKLEVEINLGCNRRCTYCNLSSERREDYVQTRHRTMEWDLFRLLVGQLVEIEYRGVLCFHFYAEPLLNKQLGRYASYVREHLPETQCIVYSNGDYLTAQRHRELSAAGVSLFFVTRHDNVIPDFLAQVLEEPNVLLDTRADMIMNNRAGLLGAPTDQRVRDLPCIFTSETLVITIDGNVLPCSCDFRESNRFGNIRETHIREIYNSEACRRFRQNLLAGRRGMYALCRDCDYYCEVLGVPSAAEPYRAHEQLTVVQIRRQAASRKGGE